LYTSERAGVCMCIRKLYIIISLGRIKRWNATTTDIILVCIIHTHARTHRNVFINLYGRISLVLLTVVRWSNGCRRAVTANLPHPFCPSSSRRRKFPGLSPSFFVRDTGGGDGIGPKRRIERLSAKPFRHRPGIRTIPGGPLFPSSLS